MNARPMTPARLAAWLALGTARALPAAALRALLSAFGEPQTVLAQPYRVLAEAVGEKAARAVAAAARTDTGDEVERTSAWCALPGHALVTLDDPAYPGALLNLHDPPPLLYVCGGLEWLHVPSVAIVGSRNATPQGIEDAAHFARELAGAGLVIVSGLALGIDAAAHRGALESGGGTVAVIGTGPDLVYPAQHRALAHDIAARGAIVSEWPLGTPAKPAHFPQRNRLIAGMVKGVLVVEAAQRSGSLITARLANEMGRDVFAIPGSIHAPLSRGCHHLIKDGAKLTETPSDIFEELGLAQPLLEHASQHARATGAPVPRAGSQAAENRASGDSPAIAKRRRPVADKEHEDAQPTGFGARSPAPLGALPLFAGEPDPRPPPALSAAAAYLLDALGHAPAALEILAARTEMSSAALQAALLELELRGHLTVLPGGRYVRHERR